MSSRKYLVFFHTLLNIILKFLFFPNKLDNQPAPSTDESNNDTPTTPRVIGEPFIDFPLILNEHLANEHEIHQNALDCFNNLIRFHRILMRSHELERSIMNDHQVIQPIVQPTTPVNSFTQYRQQINMMIDIHMSRFFVFIFF